MGKILNTYRTFTPAAMKARADIPDALYITEGVNTIDCSNISLNGVKNLIGSGTFSLYENCRHANVNQHSCFTPKVRGLSGVNYDRVMTFSNPTECRLGDFAGYNHQAVIPGWQTGGQAAAEANIWVNNNSTATINANIDIGEIDYHSEFGAHGVVMLIFNSSDAIVGWGQTELSTVGSAFTLSGEVLNVAMDHLDYYGMAFITDTYPIAQAEDVISSLICRVPNISTWEVNLKVKAVSTWYYAGTNNQTLPDGWVQNGGAAMNFNTGVFNIGSIANAASKNVRVQVIVTDWLGNTVGNGYVVGPSGYVTYNPGDDDLTGSIDLGDFADYGYTAVVSFLYS